MVTTVVACNGCMNYVDFGFESSEFMVNYGERSGWRSSIESSEFMIVIDFES